MCANFMPILFHLVSFHISEEEYSGKSPEVTKKFRMEAIQLAGLIPGKSFFCIFAKDSPLFFV